MVSKVTVFLAGPPTRINGLIPLTARYAPPAVRFCSEPNLATLRWPRLLNNFGQSHGSVSHPNGWVIDISSASRQQRRVPDAQEDELPDP